MLLTYYCIYPDNMKMYNNSFDLFWFNRPGSQEYEVWFLLFTPQCWRHVPAFALASRRVLQISHSARLWLPALCTIDHHQRQRPRYGRHCHPPYCALHVVPMFLKMWFVFLSEMRAVPLINPGRGGFEELRLHFLTEKEQQQKDKLLKDYLMLIEIPVIGLGYDPTQIITAARYLWLPFYCIIICCIIYVTVIWDTFCKKKYMWVMAE